MPTTQNQDMLSAMTAETEADIVKQGIDINSPLGMCLEEDALAAKAEEMEQQEVKAVEEQQEENRIKNNDIDELGTSYGETFEDDNLRYASDGQAVIDGPEENMEKDVDKENDKSLEEEREDEPIVPIDFSGFDAISEHSDAQTALDIAIQEDKEAEADRENSLENNVDFENDEVAV